ncbi:putative N(6)-adenine-specific DNA methyltransferase 2 isoform X3 [Apostichopus japonicus]|uniref:Putative N(6)-adenine-specific DNA methyltransferase 2 isoform X3 n=1 Tax=Stichopus japonicus TaxID=307972 RepID=A0A2G8LGE4_STIJA|nr:putative N(6)-adenine-specific DNA methyltransferase 2 isoform X3 [Apostichopus japonicus]
MSSDSDDETPQLSIHALCALQEFLSEQQEVESESKQRKAARQLSQFWYNDDTAEVLAKEALHIAGPKGRIACLSSPTLFQKLCQMKADLTVVLFEYDKRFDAYGEDFVFYDFNEPLSLPKHIAEHSFDLVVGDPPFLQDRCWDFFLKR